MSKKAKKENITFVAQTTEKLKEQLVGAKKELFNLRCQKVIGETSDTSRFKKVRRNVARIFTELTKRARSV